MSHLKNQIEQSHQLAVQGMDVPWLLDQWVNRTPDKTFMVWAPFDSEEQAWSYSEVQAASLRVATGLRNLGVKQGDFVLIHLDNSPEFIFSWFACAILGAVAVSTNTRSVARDMTYFSEHTQAVCAITEPAYAGMLMAACELEFVVLTDNDTDEAKSPDLISNDGFIAFSTLLSSEADETLKRPVSSATDLAVQFTSGTTSRPKAVLWTHANAIWGGKVSASHMRIRHDDRTLIFMPLFHTNAQSYSMLATLWVGGTFVLQPKFSASRFWPISTKHQITWLSTIPFAFKAIASQPVPDHSYRFWGTGAFIPALKKVFGIDIIGWWGMTETITHGIVTDVDHPGPHGTMGRKAPEYDIEIRKDDGALAGTGERGHLFIRGVRGVSLFKEYYRNDAANQEAFDKDGWFETGDLVKIGPSGDLFFSDRDKDMLKIGAENVAASEIESVLMQSGKVAECAVVAQKHYMLDEMPVAFVIAASDKVEPAELLAYCQENLADFKVPVEIRLVDTLPRSMLEKIAKNELRKLLSPIEK